MPRTSHTRRVPGLAAALLLSAAALSGCHVGFAQEEATDRWTETYTIERGATFELHNTNGRIEIAPAEGDRIEVVAERVARAHTADAAREALAGIEVRDTADRMRVRIESRVTGMSVGTSRMVNYTVRLPAWTNVSIETTNGDVRIERLDGRLRVDATNGRVEATDLMNGAAVDTTNGAISLSFAALGDQGIACETTNGAITVTLPREAGADITARVLNGAISTGDLDLAFTEQSRRRVDARLGPGGTRVRLETTNGAIRLRGR